MILPASAMPVMSSLSYVPPLDIVSMPLAFSITRKLRSDYNGALFNLTRKNTLSGNSGSLDIFALPNGEVDIASITAFLSGFTYGSIASIYNQGTANINQYLLRNGTPVQQPLIFDSTLGGLFYKNGKLAMAGDNAQRHLVFNNTSLVATQVAPPSNYLMLMTHGETLSTRWTWMLGGGINTFPSLLCPRTPDSIAASAYVLDLTNPNTASGARTAANDVEVFAIKSISGVKSASIDGTNLTLTASNAGTYSNWDGIGRFRSGATFYFSEGFFQEMIMSLDTSANAFENQLINVTKSFYGIA